MSRQATLFQSWGSRPQKEPDGGDQGDTSSTNKAPHNGGSLEGMGEDIEDEDLLLAMAMEESLRDIQQPGPSNTRCEPASPRSISKSKKTALMQKQSQLFSSIKNPARSMSKSIPAPGPEPPPAIDLTEVADEPEHMPDISEIPDLPGFDKYAGRMYIYPTNYPVREYQFSIVKEALFKNTLVVLPTGLGKTFIAAVVMYNYYRWYPQGKVIFMAPTKPLVAQQIEACYNIMGIPQEDTAEMTGAMQPAERQKSWNMRRIFFLTPQVLTNDLSRSACPANQVKCLVVDEAHKALGNHAYCQVVRELVKHSTDFRVLALSATPGSDIKAVQQVLTNLLVSHVELRSEDSPDLKRYTHERIVDKIVVPLGDELKAARDKYLLILEALVQRLKRQGVLYSREAKSLSKFLILKARDAFRQNPPANLQQHQFGVIEGDFALCMSLYHGYELLQLHGLRSLFNFLNGIVSGEKSNGRTRTELQKNTTFCELLESLRQKFDPVKSMDPNASFRSQMTPSQLVPTAHGHPKMDRLETIVIEHFNTFREKHPDNPNTSIMIFSQYRDSVNEITELLNKHRPLVKVMSFVGQSSAGKSSRGFTQKEQLKVMRQFRDGGYNTLVSTCVGEEGLDIGDVDLIICFDAHKSPIRLVQRMGRTGRKREGRIVMLVTEGKEEQIYNQSQYNKKSIHKAILNGARSLIYYANNPSMMPEGLRPVCHKMHLTVHTKYEARSKGRAVARPATTTKAKVPALKKPGSGVLKSGFLSESQLKYWSEHYRLPAAEMSYLPQSHFVTLQPQQQEQAPCDGVELSLTEWMPWQNTLQPTGKAGHSTLTKHFVQLMEFIDIQSAVGDDEDTYGQEMALYLNEDDVLQHGQSNHMTLGNHGILRYCNKSDQATGKVTEKRQSKRSDPLPQFDDDLVTLDDDDDDDELPVISCLRSDIIGSGDEEEMQVDPDNLPTTKGKSGGRGQPKNKTVKHKHAEKQAANNDCGSIRTKPTKGGTSAKNKLKAFHFTDRNDSEPETVDAGVKRSVLGKKKQRNSSDKQQSIITIIRDEEDDDFDLPNIKLTNVLSEQTKHVMEVVDIASRSPESCMEVEDGRDSVSDVDEAMDTSPSKPPPQADDDDDEVLSRLLPIFSPTSKDAQTSPVTAKRLNSPPPLEEISLAFAELDKRGRISPLDILDLVDTWAQPRPSISDSVLQDLQEESMVCSRDNQGQGHTRSRSLSGDPTNAGTTANVGGVMEKQSNIDDDILVGSDVNEISFQESRTSSYKASVCSKNIKVSQSYIKINETSRSDIKEQEMINKDGFNGRKLDATSALCDTFDDDSLFDNVSLVHCEKTALKRKVKPLFKRHSSSDNKSTTSNESCDISTVQLKGSVVLGGKPHDSSILHTVNETVREEDDFMDIGGLDVADFNEPFTLEAPSQKLSKTGVKNMPNVNVNDTLHCRNSPFRAPQAAPSSTSTPMLPPQKLVRTPQQNKHTVLETPGARSSTLDTHNSFFDEDDSMFAGVSFSGMDARPASVHIPATKTVDNSQITFTQALDCMDTGHDTGSLVHKTHTDSNKLKPLNETNSDVIVNNCDKSSNKDSKSVETSEKSFSSDIQQPQFDLGFDLDIDLDEFEEEIIPPSPEHVIRPPGSQRLTISLLKPGDQTVVGLNVPTYSNHHTSKAASDANTYNEKQSSKTHVPKGSMSKPNLSTVEEIRPSLTVKTMMKPSVTGVGKQPPAQRSPACNITSKVSQSSDVPKSSVLSPVSVCESKSYLGVSTVSSGMSKLSKNRNKLSKSVPKMPVISEVLTHVSKFSNVQAVRTIASPIVDIKRTPETEKKFRPVAVISPTESTNKITSNSQKKARSKPHLPFDNYDDDDDDFIAMAMCVDDRQITPPVSAAGQISWDPDAETMGMDCVDSEQVAERTKSLSESDDEDESIIQMPRKKVRAAVLMSPDTPHVHHSPDDDPFKTPLKPAPRAKLPGGKRPRVSSEEESPIIRPRAKKAMLMDDLSLAEDDDFVVSVRPERKSSSEGDHRRQEPEPPAAKTKHKKKRRGGGCGFIDEEAELSESDGKVSSDESDGSDMDQYDNSFINDLTQMSQVVDPADMRAVYLQSVRSPALGSGGYKLAYGRGADMDVFSQVPQQDSEYQQDSFCVHSDEEESELIDYDTEPSLLEPRGIKIRRQKESKFAELREKHRQKKYGVSRASVTAKPHQVSNVKHTEKVNSKGTEGRRRIVHEIDSSSQEEEEEVVDLCNNKASLTKVVPKQTVISPVSSHSTSAEESPPLLSLKSRLQNKMHHQGNSIVTKNMHSAGEMNYVQNNHQTRPQLSDMSLRRSTQKNPNHGTSILPRKDHKSVASRATENATFSLGMDDLDFDLDDDVDDMLVPSSQIEAPQNNQLTKTHHSPTLFKQPNTIMKSSVQSSNQVPVPVSPPGAQSRNERLRLSRLKQEEFRKKMAQQKDIGNKAEISGYDGNVSFGSSSFNMSTVNQVFDVSGTDAPNTTGSHGKSTSGVTFTSIKDKLVVLIDSREISSAQDLVSTLRFKHNLYTSIKSIGHCDYILSNRMAVERKLMSDFTNGAQRQKLLERIRIMCELFERPCIIVERDRVKAGTKDTAKPLLCTKYVETVVASLAQTHIKLLYSENQEQSAALISHLCLQEHRKKMSISVSVELTPAQEQVLKFYLSMPKVSYILALNLLHYFKNISEFIRSPVVMLEKRGRMSRVRAKELYMYLRHKFDPQMLKSGPR